jgi:hypothetical protein
MGKRAILLAFFSRASADNGDFQMRLGEWYNDLLSYRTSVSNGDAAAGSGKYVVGEKVMVRWNRGTVLYQATIVKDNGGGSFAVKYAGGTTDNRVAENLISPNTSGASPVEHAMKKLAVEVVCVDCDALPAAAARAGAGDAILPWEQFPWPFVPGSWGQHVKHLKATFQVSQAPQLVVLDGATGQVVQRNATPSLALAHNRRQDQAFAQAEVLPPVAPPSVEFCDPQLVPSPLVSPAASSAPSPLVPPAPEAGKEPQTAMYTSSDGTQEEVTIVKKMTDAEGGGYTIFIPSVGHERSTTEERLNFNVNIPPSLQAPSAPPPSDNSTSFLGSLLPTWSGPNAPNDALLPESSGRTEMKGMPEMIFLEGNARKQRKGKGGRKGKRRKKGKRSNK